MNIMLEAALSDSAAPAPAPAPAATATATATTAVRPGDGWRARLALQVQRDDDGRCIVRAEHHGPLRLLKPLYPEGPAIAHAVIVHPPGGIVGGDALAVALDLAAGAHALVSTPGATRFYRSAGADAQQQVHATLADGARLEWLPLETIATSGCRARSAARFELAPLAEMIGWDVLALGAPAAGEAFASGRFEQRIELPGVWLERGVIDAGDRRLLHSPLGLAGRSALLTLWFAAGRALVEARREALLDAAREAIAAHAALDAAAAQGLVAGATAPQAQVVVLRALAPRVEPAMALARDVRARWRTLAWALPATVPRIWRT